MDKTNLAISKTVFKKPLIEYLAITQIQIIPSMMSIMRLGDNDISPPKVYKTYKIQNVTNKFYLKIPVIHFHTS